MVAQVEAWSFAFSFLLPSFTCCYYARKSLSGMNFQEGFEWRGGKGGSFAEKADYFLTY